MEVTKLHLFLDVQFPPNVQKVLGPDADTVPFRDLTELLDFELDENSVNAVPPHCEKEEDIMMGGYNIRNVMYQFNATTYWITNLNIWDIDGIKRIGWGDMFRALFHT